MRSLYPFTVAGAVPGWFVIERTGFPFHPVGRPPTGTPVSKAFSDYPHGSGCVKGWQQRGLAV